MILINLVIIAGCIALNAFFVAVEYAVIASRRSRLETLASGESRSLELVLSWLGQSQRRDRVIAANQVAITLINLAVGALSENTFSLIFAPIFSKIQFYPPFTFLESVVTALPIILGLIIATGLQVVFGELVPKVAVLRAPEKFALFSARWIDIFTRVFKHFISLLEWIAKSVLNIIGVDTEGTNPASMSLEEMRAIFSGPEMDGVIEKPERDMLSAVLDFGEMVVRQVAIPRTEMIAIDYDATMPEILAIFSEHPVSKLPVFQGNLDQITGILYIRDIIKVLLEPDPKTATAGKLAREVLYVPETISVNHLLYQFRSRRQHIAIVLDEYGGTSGLVTLEDLVEEIVGDYRDSFESQPPPIQIRPDGSFLVDGLTLMEDIEDQLGIHLSNPNYDTIAGFILGKLGRLAIQGDVVEDLDAGVRLIVHSMDRLRIARVIITRLESKSKDLG